MVGLCTTYSPRGNLISSSHLHELRGGKHDRLVPYRRARVAHGGCSVAVDVAELHDAEWIARAALVRGGQVLCAHHLDKEVPPFEGVGGGDVIGAVVGGGGGGLGGGV